MYCSYVWLVMVSHVTYSFLLLLFLFSFLGN